MAKTGRPRIQIDWEQFDKLAGLNCTQAEIADWFECTDDTINNAVKREKGLTYSEYYDKKRNRGRISLRRKQWEVAQSGNVTMLIWLGKQYLGQTDKVEQKSNDIVDPGALRILMEHATALKDSSDLNGQPRVVNEK